MEEYHKIQTVFLRDPATKYKTLLDGQFAKPEFGYLKDCQWIFTEKVDGTNIRVDYLDRVNNMFYTMKYGGRTDNAQIPTFLYDKLQELFPYEKLEYLYPETSMTLYGEGYGAKIQKGGGNYISNGCNFILFDVMINGNWLERENVEDIAEKLGIKIVPIVYRGTLCDGIGMLEANYIPSRLRDTPPEGIVIRPKVELKDRRGQRIITKLKLKDFHRP
jgi:ATP-dependent RNA circularization protein (DNA/RNA ligase family)